MGQHTALEEASAHLWPGERIFAYLNDIYLVTMPERVGAVHPIVELRVQAKIRIHSGKTKVWNRAGERPQICDVLECIARVPEPTSCCVEGVWHSMKVLGTPAVSDR